MANKQGRKCLKNCPAWLGLWSIHTKVVLSLVEAPKDGLWEEVPFSGVNPYHLLWVTRPVHS